MYVLGVYIIFLKLFSLYYYIRLLLNTFEGINIVLKTYLLCICYFICKRRLKKNEMIIKKYSLYNIAIIKILLFSRKTTNRM